MNLGALLRRRAAESEGPGPTYVAPGGPAKLEGITISGYQGPQVYANDAPIDKVPVIGRALRKLQREAAHPWQSGPGERIASAVNALTGIGSFVDGSDPFSAVEAPARAMATVVRVGGKLRPAASVPIPAVRWKGLAEPITAPLHFMAWEKASEATGQPLHLLADGGEEGFMLGGQWLSRGEAEEYARSKKMLDAKSAERRQEMERSVPNLPAGLHSFDLRELPR